MNKKLISLIKKSIVLVFTLFLICFLISLGIFHKHLARPTYSPVKLEYIERGRSYFESLNAQQMIFMADDGIELSGLLVPNEQAKRVVIVCHGFQASKEMMSDCVQALYDSETIFFLFDFRAHGSSQGSYVSLVHHEKKDLYAAIKYLRSQEDIKHLPLYGIGVSMGGAILLSTASEMPVFEGLVIDSTFADIKQQLIRSFKQKTNLPLFPFIHILRLIFEHVHDVSMIQLSPQQIINKINVPVLFIHSRDDIVTPLSEGKCLFHHKNGTKDIWIVESARHAQTFRAFPEHYREKVKQFFLSAENSILKE